MAKKASTMLGFVLVAAAIGVATAAQKGKPTDTEVIVALPAPGSVGCGAGPNVQCRLTRDELRDELGEYQTDSTKGVNSILLGTDGNLSLQFDPVGKGKSAVFERTIEVDWSHRVAGSGPLPDATLEPDYLFAAPDDGTGLNCDLAKLNCCDVPEDPSTCVGTFGTVTGSWDNVRLLYRFDALVEDHSEERHWTLLWNDKLATDGRFAKLECLEPAGTSCNVWRLTPDPTSDPPDLASLSSRARGTDVQETGDFVVPTEIIVCRAGVDWSKEFCSDYLTVTVP